jgi:hypothetical protein
MTPKELTKALQDIDVVFITTKEIESEEGLSVMADAYFKSFKNIPVKAFEWAVTKYIKDGGKYFPKPGEIYGILPATVAETYEKHEEILKVYDVDPYIPPISDWDGMQSVWQRNIKRRQYEREQAKIDAKMYAEIEDRERRHRSKNGGQR